MSPHREDDESTTPPPPAGAHPRHIGFVGLAGAPNVGKSTFVNHVVGQKISIVSDRPQTTRERVCGILTDERMQVVFVDIPGILAPRDRFNQVLMEAAAQGLKGCDLVLHLRDARRPEDPADEPVREMIRLAQKPVWQVWNKIDRIPSKMFPARAAGELPYEKTFGISGKTGRGVPPLLAALAEALPLGELMYDPDQLSDRDLRFIAAELVREKLFRYLGEEIPYALTTFTETFDENRDEKVYIRVMILTEREAHKPIIIGQHGAMLKKIGQAARLEIERLLERPVFLELWVKVRPKWRSSESQLAELGLKPPVSS